MALPGGSAAEIIKRRIPGLYQNNKITSISLQVV